MKDTLITDQQPYHFTTYPLNEDCEIEYQEFDPAIPINDVISCYSRIVIREIESQKIVWEEQYPNNLSDKNRKIRVMEIKTNPDKFIPAK